MQQKLDKKLIIYTDGASLGNPGSGGYGAVLVFPVLDEVVELGGNKAQTTNNEMELTAVVSALAHASMNTAPTHIYTDSSYVINGITKWVHGWQKNGWKTKSGDPVSHQQLWQTLVSLVSARTAETLVTWNHVPGHVGVSGNERADEIASGFAKDGRVNLYRGKLAQYDIKDIEDSSYDAEAHDKRQEKKARSRAKAYSYLSLVDGELKRHETWAECEARVKGKKAKFKKALSADEEKEIAKDWGVALG